MKLYAIWVTWTRPCEARRIYQYLCDYHAPVAGGTLTPCDEATAEVVSVTSRAVTEDEVANYGADECDCCRGDVAIGRPAAEAQP